MDLYLPDLSTISVYLSEFPSRISLALIIAFFSLLLLFVFYAFLAFKRLQFVFFQARDKYWSKLISDTFTDFLAYADGMPAEDPISYILPEFEKIPLKRPYIKKMLYQQLIDFHNSFTGNSAEKLGKLFLKLGLDQLTEKKLHALKEDVKIKGIIETAQMELHRFIPIITKLIHSQSAEVRIEAQATYLLLNKQHSFHFLEQVKEPILDWHQLVLMELTGHIPTKELPDFSVWLNSKNNSVVIFCLRLIGHYQQFQAIPRLIDLLKHSDPTIQHLAVKILGEFEAAEAEKHLLDLYATGSVDIRAEVIRALGRICSGNQLDFLLKEAKSEEFDIIYHSLTALRNHGKPGLSIIKAYYSEAPQTNKEIIEQVLDTVK
jgi:hypothetical protein